MDFGWSEEQASIRELARQIFEGELPLERLKQVEAAPHAIDEALWKRLAEANLLGITLSEEHGGLGLGFLELCVLLEEAGRRLAPVPLFETLVLGALPIARFGTPEQRSAWLPRVAAGEVVLGAALDAADAAPGAAPTVAARRSAGGFALHGTRRGVAAAGRAARLLVPAALEAGGTAIFLLDPEADGVRRVAARSSTGAPLAEVELDGARAGEDARLGGPDADGAAQLAWLHERALAALAALQTGVCARALEITAAYVTERHQFGVPIGSFQAVQHRAADAFIDLEALRWCTWRAAWRLAEERPAAREAAIAKFWAAEAGARIAGACLHLHGGLGADTDYPIQRHFLWSKSLELALGGASQQLARLGRELAAEVREAR